MITPARERVSHLVEMRYDALAQEVIAALKSMGEEYMQSSLRTGVANIWDEYRDQLQSCESLVFYLYQDQIHNYSLKALDNLSLFKLRSLWTGSRAFADNHDEEEDLDFVNVEDIAGSDEAVCCLHYRVLWPV